MDDLDNFLGAADSSSTMVGAGYAASGSPSNPTIGTQRKRKRYYACSRQVISKFRSAGTLFGKSFEF